MLIARQEGIVYIANSCIGLAHAPTRIRAWAAISLGTPFPAHRTGLSRLFRERSASSPLIRVWPATVGRTPVCELTLAGAVLGCGLRSCSSSLCSNMKFQAGRYFRDQVHSETMVLRGSFQFAETRIHGPVMVKGIS